MDQYSEAILNKLKEIGRIPVEDRKMRAKFRLFLHKLLNKEPLIEDALLSFDWSYNENNELIMVPDGNKK